MVPKPLAVVLISFIIISKLGRALAPALLGDWPLLLLVLNASDLHCALTSASVGFMPWFTIATVRRLAPDPVGFWAGWHYKAQALEWLRGWSPGAANGFAQAEAYFRRASYAAVAINAGTVVSCLAGISRMRPCVFFFLDLAGTVLRLLTIRYFGNMFPNQLEYVLEIVRKYQFYLLMVATIITCAWFFQLWRHNRCKQASGSKVDSLSSKAGCEQEEVK